MTAAFIITDKEWRFALSGEGDALSLCEKGMAKRGGDGGYTLARELQVIVEEFNGAELEEIEAGVTAARGKRFCMLFEPYSHLDGAMKISLHENGAALEKELRERSERGND